MISNKALECLCQTYFTIIPKTNKIVSDIRDDVSANSNRASAQFRLAIQYLLTQLL